MLMHAPIHVHTEEEEEEEEEEKEESYRLYYVLRIFYAQKIVIDSLILTELSLSYERIRHTQPTYTYPTHIWGI